MKLYRLDMLAESRISWGFEFFASKREAEKALREWEEQCGKDDSQAKIDMIEVAPTKAGILRALNLYASHPDNG